MIDLFVEDPEDAETIERSFLGSILPAPVPRRPVVDGRAVGITRIVGSKEQ